MGRQDHQQLALPGRVGAVLLRTVSSPPEEHPAVSLCTQCLGLPLVRLGWKLRAPGDQSPAHPGQLEKVKEQGDWVSALPLPGLEAPHAQTTLAPGTPLVLVFLCACFRCHWGGGNWQAKGALHQEMAGTLQTPCLSQEQLPSAPHPIIAAAGWPHLFPSLATSTHLNLGPWVHEVGKDAHQRRAQSWMDPVGLDRGDWAPRACQPAGATTAPSDEGTGPGRPSLTGTALYLARWAEQHARASRDRQTASSGEGFCKGDGGKAR